MNTKKAVCLGAGGFIGGHLCRYLKSKGYFVRGVDLVPNSNLVIGNDFDEFLILDLRKLDSAKEAVKDMDEVYALAALNGSIEYTSKVKAPIITDNALINLNIAQACVWDKQTPKDLFFSSSACVYPLGLQENQVVYLREEDSYPANPDSEYGWEKLFSERVYQSYSEDYGLKVHIARFFNIYGPEGHTDTLRMKAPTAISKKVAQAQDGGTIEVWGGNGNAVRSYCYIDDCLRGIYAVMHSGMIGPFNIGTDEHMSVDQLVDTIAKVAGKRIHKKYTKQAQGVLHRYCDYTTAKKMLNWYPQVTFEDGIRRTYEWVQKTLI